MWEGLGNVVAGVFLTLTLLLLPGMALMRWCVPAPNLGLLSRLALAPGVTVAFCVLLFTWCKLAGLKLTPLTPWFLVAAALLSLCFRIQSGRLRLIWPLLSLPRKSWRRFVRFKYHRLSVGLWLPALSLILLLTIPLIVRFRSTWGWSVPPGIDSPQHSLIVQLLIDHRGLFASWAPYSDAETFTYHFGFHAVATLFAWMWGTDAASAIFMVARVMGLCAAAALYPLVRLWTRSPWGGVFAVAIWGIYSRQLYAYELPGRWTLLTGLTLLSSALVLTTLFLGQTAKSKLVPMGFLSGLTAAGLVLAHYTTAIVFAVLAAGFFCSRIISVVAFGRGRRLQNISPLISRAFVIAALALLLAAPRLIAVMEAKAGRHLQRVVIEAPAANPAAFGAPRSTLLQLLQPGFTPPQKAILSCLALAGAAALLFRRDGAPWYVIGWLGLAVVMNPRLLGLERAGLLDEIYWKYVIQTAVAVAAGAAIGYFCDAFNRRRGLAWDVSLAIIALACMVWSVARLSSMPDSRRFVLPDDLRLMKWMREHIPQNDMIAGRAFFEYGYVHGYDAALWLPYFTRHHTQHTNLAAAIEKAAPEFRQKLKTFTRELYARDMSTAESARWMQDQGFRWFFAGAQPPEAADWVEGQAERDHRLLSQLSQNPRVSLAHAEGAARVLRID